MSFQNEITLITNIIEETNKAKIFVHKCRKTVLVLEQIKKELEQIQSLLSIDSEYQSPINESLKKLLEIVHSLGNDEYIDTFLLSNDPIQQPATNINNCLQNIFDLLNQYKSTSPFEMPQEYIFQDLEYIDKLLTNPKYKNQELVQQRRNKISLYIKQIQMPQNDSNNISNSEDNITILKSHPKYKLNPSDYIKRKKYTDNDLFTSYSGEMASDPQKKLRIMKLHDNSKFKRIFSILTTIKHPYFEKFVGASIDGENIEIVTLKEGISLKNVILMKRSENDEEEEENNDDNNELYLEPGDRTILAFKIAQAMVYLHSLGIIHRNLSWSNIYVKKVPSQIEEGQLEIVPIISNFANSHLLSKSSILIGMTNIHMNASITSFVAPELIDTTNYNEKVDVFAFAGILYELLTDDSPFADKAKARDNIWTRIKDGQRPNISSNCPKRLKKLIETSWNQNYLNRPSFYEIVDYMLSKIDDEQKIIFPNDKSGNYLVTKFYKQNSINSNSAKHCLDTFESINRNIGFSDQYRFQLFRARPVIQNYQYLFRTSKYPSTKSLNADDKLKIIDLSNNLKRLLEVVLNASEDRWNQSALLYEVDLITNQLNEYMEKVFNSLKELNINVTEKYVEKDNDLVFDYDQLINVFQLNIDHCFQLLNKGSNNKDDLNNLIDAFQQKIDDINDFLKKRDLLGDKSNEVLIDQINDLFEQYKPQFEKNSTDYQIIQEISSGATSSVYLGQDETNNKEVAIKELNDEHIHGGVFSLVLLGREISVLARLKHEYIAKFIGFCIPHVGEKEAYVWLISEYIGNGSLFTLKTKLNGFQKTKIAFEIAEAMEYIHAHRIIHRDLKTDNILIDDECSPKIIDFGYSTTEISDITKTSKAGTYNYMAPEVIEGGIYGTEADVYSFGMILWELMSNKLPFEKLSTLQIQNVVLKGPKLDFTGCPAPLNDLILRCINKIPSKRPSFSKIIKLMMNRDDYIMLNGADLRKVKEFYDAKALKRKNLKLI